MYVTRHAADRLAERFPSTHLQGALADRAAAAAIRGRKVAVVIDRQPVLAATSASFRADWDAPSNGDLTVGIVSWADHEPAPTLVTVMYRRSGQPLDARRLDVQRVVYAPGV